MRQPRPPLRLLRVKLRRVFGAKARRWSELRNRSWHFQSRGAWPSKGKRRRVAFWARNRSNARNYLFHKGLGHLHHLNCDVTRCRAAARLMQRR